MKRDDKLIFEAYAGGIKSTASILDPIRDQVITMTDKKYGGSAEKFPEALQLVKDTISNSKINPTSKAEMLHAVKGIEETGDLQALWRFLINAQFAKQGMKVYNPGKF